MSVSVCVCVCVCVSEKEKSESERVSVRERDRKRGLLPPIYDSISGLFFFSFDCRTFLSPFVPSSFSVLKTTRDDKPM